MGKSGVKVHGSTVKLLSILLILSVGEDDGIHGVAVKCVDIMKNTGCEGGHLAHN